MDVKIIKKTEGRINRQTGLRLFDRLRVTAYARVSTGDEEQLSSYESQKQYYKEKIKNNPEWNYVGIYADEGISGTQDHKRNEFMKMMQDGLDNKFDVIMTKSISRFARNTLDTLKYVRILKEKNVAVFFEEENINTLEMSGELLLTILSSVAQQESETISSHVKQGLKMRRERGEIVCFSSCLGYRYNVKTKKIEIDEKEAEIVRFIFDKYCEGYGADGIAKLLTKMKVKTPRNKNTWYSSTIRTIIRNEKYKGDILQGKTFTVDPISHRRLTNLGEEDKYYISNFHDSIISKEQFDLVQETIQEKSGIKKTGRRLGNISRKYPFSNRLFCGFCGDVLTRRNVFAGNGIKIPQWHCIKSNKYGKENCMNSKLLKEEIIEEAFVDVYRLLCSNDKFAVNDFLINMKQILKETTPKGEIAKLQSQKSVLFSKKDKLLELMIENTISKEEYKEKSEKYITKIESLEKRISQLELLVEDDESIENGLKKFKDLFEKNDMIEEFDKEIFDALVDYVIIGGYDEKGNKDHFLIKFILKNDYSITNKKEIPRELIVNKNTVIENDEKILLDFINRQNIKKFEKDKNGKTTMIRINTLRIIVEYDIIR